MPSQFLEGGQCEGELGGAQSGLEETPKPGQQLRNPSQPLASFQALAGAGELSASEAEGDGDASVWNTMSKSDSPG